MNRTTWKNKELKIWDSNPPKEIAPTGRDILTADTPLSLPKRHSETSPVSIYVALKSEGGRVRPADSAALTETSIKAVTFLRWLQVMYFFAIHWLKATTWLFQQKLIAARDISEHCFRADNDLPTKTKISLFQTYKCQGLKCLKNSWQELQAWNSQQSSECYWISSCTFKRTALVSRICNVHIQLGHLLFESNRDKVAWLGCLAGKGRLLLLGINVPKWWLEDPVIKIP